MDIYIYYIGNVIHKLMNAHLFIKSVIRWVYYDFEYNLVYFYPNLKLL